MGAASPTIRDVARLANVSVATVSRALNGHDNVAEAVRTRVLEIASTLDYSPHHAARSLSRGRTHTIGVVLPDLPCEFFARLMCGIDASARERGLQLLVSGHHRSAESQAAAVRVMRGRVDGLLAISPYAGLDIASANLPRSLPVLLLDSDPSAEGVSTLGVDNHAGAVAMMRHLVDCGYRDIAFISGRVPHFNASERLRGYFDAMEALLPGVSPRVIQGDFDVQSGSRAGDELLAGPKRPDAVFAANDMMALGCMFAFQRAGLRVPEDVAVAGFNDIPLASHTSPPLTSMRIDISRLGSDAFDMLLERMEGDANDGARIVQPELVVRGSTARR
ncbi:MAG: LacI family transcriptional regulator [Pseudomonadota bacterium]|nr:LacI family transcriptional regulator [Pseudomonadota bacterium]